MTGGSRLPEREAATETLAKASTSIVDRPADIPAQLRRRADAAMPMRPIVGRWGDSLAARDPALAWPPGEEDLSPGALAAWQMAIDHLLEVGMTPVIPVAVRRARAGGR